MMPGPVNKTRLTPRETMGVVMVLLERNLKLMTRFSVSTLMFYMGVLSEAAISAFLGKTLIGGANIAQIGGDYVSYVIIGLAYSQLMQTSISAPLQSLSGAYWSSRLEPLLRAPVSIRTVVLADCLWYYLNDLVTIGVYVLVGSLFGMKLSGGPVLFAGLGALILGCVSVLGFGFLSASMFNLINAKGHSEPVEWLVKTLQRLVCGVYFPITVLPGWLRGLGSLMPQTYVLDCVRRLLMPSYPRGHTLPVHGTLPMSPQVINVFAIVSLTALILPLGFWAFKKGLDKARNDGGLSRWN